jgi:hypothetical protein
VRASALQHRCLFCGDRSGQHRHARELQCYTNDPTRAALVTDAYTHVDELLNDRLPRTYLLLLLPDNSTGSEQGGGGHPLSGASDGARGPSLLSSIEIRGGQRPID